MKTFRTSAGPFSERPYYTQREIEEICVTELSGAGCLPSSPEPIRIDRFIEKRFGITHEYDDLGAAILGYTRFGPQGPISVVVSRALDEEGTTVANRRIRTTLGHEAGHILLQGHLFALAGGATLSLFGSDADVTAAKILCRDNGQQNQPRRAVEWWEFQANRAMGALLLPRSLVSMKLETLLTPEGSFGVKGLAPESRAEAVAMVTEAFDVNPVVARLRLEELWPVGDEKQLRL